MNGLAAKPACIRIKSGLKQLIGKLGNLKFTKGLFIFALARYDENSKLLYVNPNKRRKWPAKTF
ncbi:MAG: hypothetical protein A2527_13720 [Candidatus Lambdaproteobacteria bacterium RIFOXYD2_FULL_50_16]|uniref:Uncharacterized protein n=1 Tax=Candidatus Lambdaproteobacteria bacterium RIFOXYD2_FULL_50_16 TaxID=1817772 RepID=A0A1F6G5B7_9PROT|nr:MAG: hypothetical protein A2527_13720 [Candidatus Lambdaproteobacteria bacterium RIFOXYD2_FULL_50_16]